jgi:hypothetical protein
MTLEVSLLIQNRDTLVKMLRKTHSSKDRFKL